MVHAELSSSPELPTNLSTLFRIFGPDFQDTRSFLSDLDWKSQKLVAQSYSTGALKRVSRSIDLFHTWLHYDDIASSLKERVASHLFKKFSKDFLDRELAYESYNSIHVLSDFASYKLISSVFSSPGFLNDDIWLSPRTQKYSSVDGIVFQREGNDVSILGSSEYHYTDSPMEQSNINFYGDLVKLDEKKHKELAGEFKRRVAKDEPRISIVAPGERYVVLPQETTPPIRVNNLDSTHYYKLPLPTKNLHGLVNAMFSDYDQIRGKK